MSEPLSISPQGAIAVLGIVFIIGAAAGVLVMSLIAREFNVPWQDWPEGQARPARNDLTDDDSRMEIRSICGAMPFSWSGRSDVEGVLPCNLPHGHEGKHMHRKPDGRVSLSWIDWEDETK